MKNSKLALAAAAIVATTSIAAAQQQGGVTTSAPGNEKGVSDSKMAPKAGTSSTTTGSAGQNNPETERTKNQNSNPTNKN